MQKIMLVLGAFLMVACGAIRSRSPLPSTPGSAVGHSIQQTLSSGGGMRSYLLHVPSSYSPGRPVPLVVNFHGLGESPVEQEGLSGMSAEADQAGFIVVYPEGINKMWADVPGARGNADEEFVRALIQALEKQYAIDDKRIFATGISNGGGMTNRLGCDLADTIAAIAPVAGAYNFWQDCNPSRSVPVLAFHGLADRVVPYEGTKIGTISPPIHDWAAAWAQRDQCGPIPVTEQASAGVASETWSKCERIRRSCYTRSRIRDTVGPARVSCLKLPLRRSTRRM